MAASLCTMCPKLSKDDCSRCGEISYCSRDCQEKDWKVHSVICTVYNEFDKNSRPSLNHHLAFVFPEPLDSTLDGRTEPKLVWIESRYAEDMKCYVVDEEQVSHAMRNGQHIIKELVGFLDNKSEPTSQDKFMLLWSDRYFQVDFPPRNRIIDELAIETKWRGPVLIQTGYGDYRCPTRYDNMSVRDMHRIAKFFNEFPFQGPSYY
ncbi:hypothetical protein EG328_002138 [Venturia inaequalis]|uniref:MYND-type domain-containing protein n=1 Tax=Venturia inaequalis TaxID=5025 RepID=A0A8H3YZ43_VENIN|nr:hypothetical protein EG328_002138 [Venturia inaequalis]KAE9980569.1 hypothetical protein EG327_006515 [Venturia inaequalis]RDI80647.1 hypothetical protein Vi05172_g9377 [Venturia inaequalis]